MDGNTKIIQKSDEIKETKELRPGRELYKNEWRRSDRYYIWGFGSVL